MTQIQITGSITDESFAEFSRELDKESLFDNNGNGDAAFYNPNQFLFNPNTPVLNI